MSKTKLNQHYKGRVYITKQDDTKEIQGTTIFVQLHKAEPEELNSVAYIIRKGDKWTFDHNNYYPLDEIILRALEMVGWTEEFIHLLLTEELSTEEKALTGKEIANLIYAWADRQHMHPDDFYDRFAFELLEKMKEDK
jgi:hypothetical protein